ncbi:K02A2.6-like [Cordylochernes scorpioides]|uniref:K02A2.6-like n=1 Tax=Cordylochernes scorpioides TaxID=51811 RepID=A0ABY6LGE2_9ARAC|nr:K02A2.6-like [Cordylochernes scorpioides]
MQEENETVIQFYHRKMQLINSVELNLTSIIKLLNEGIKKKFKPYLATIDSVQPSEWLLMATKIEKSLEEPQQPSTSTRDRQFTPVNFNPNYSQTKKFQPFPRTSAATHHQQNTHKTIKLPPYPCKLCSINQIPNQMHFHRDCPLNNTPPKPINPDASSLGVAGVLKQPDEQGILHPIGYFSRKPHPYEQNYTASEIETLAIINSVQRFHTYLHNIHFTLHTDHLPLKLIKNVKNPQGKNRCFVKHFPIVESRKFYGILAKAIVDFPHRLELQIGAAQQERHKPRPCGKMFFRTKFHLMTPGVEFEKKMGEVNLTQIENRDSPVVLPDPKSRQDSGRQGTSKQIDHCLYRKMEQGREENPKEPMESDPDSESGGSTTFPKKENTLGRTEEIAPGQEDVTPPPLVSDVLGSLARTIYQLSSATGLSRDVELPRYDGSYEAQSFFDNYDAQADLAQLHYTDRLRRLPNLLQGKALHYFRSLKLDKLYYVDARQALIDLFPETTNASFAQFLAIKLTDRSSLEEYYQKKTMCGLQLNLPHKILLESLTDGLPVADQRIVAAVQPNTLQAWYSVVSRVKGTHSASQVCQQTTRTTPNPSFAPSPRYSAPRPWSARPNYSANPPPSSCRYCGAMHWHAQCPKRPAQSRPRPVYRATTYPQHDKTVLSSPAPFQVNNTRAHVTRSPDPLYTTSPAQAVNPSCPIGTSTTAPKQACSDAQDSTTVGSSSHNFR